ncbi:MAG TPA: histidine phosphatase family protein [Micromonosporaceae bacterium]|nr:histidine phosphatase family protein [Micromonosporaceae bacterium]
MTRLIVWRHGQTEWNATLRVQGQADVELDDVGRAQAAAAAECIAKEQPDAIVSSDLRRAADTAAALAAVTGLPVRLDQRLREQHFGEWQGQTNDEISARYPDAWARWGRGEAAEGLGMEDRAAFGRRAVDAVTDALTLGNVVVVVTHGGTAIHGIGGLLGLPAETSSPLVVMMNGHWAEVVWHRRRARWALQAYNVGAAPALYFPEVRPDAHRARPAASGLADAGGELPEAGSAVPAASAEAARPGAAGERRAD